jgi:hypothetical protein
VALFVLIMAVLFVAIIVASCFETQRVHEFAAAEPDTLPRPLPYAMVMNQAAKLAGFISGGVFVKNRKGPVYRIRLDLWLSPDKLSLLSITSGTLTGMRYKRSVLMSRLAADKFLVTTDSFTSEDLSGTMLTETVLNADLRELTTRHSFRLASSGVSPQPFLPSNLLSEFEQIQRTRTEHLVALGLAKFLEPSQNEWKFSLKAAWLNAYLTHTRSIPKARAQQERMNVSRPGG